MTLTGSLNPTFFSTKRTFADETAADADDEKDLRDESVLTGRCHRYIHQLSSSSHHHRLKEQTMTSEDDDEELLMRNHRGMMDFMDRVCFTRNSTECRLSECIEYN